jgi:NTP pyrophosphatase (non-canonical NTP hydrolase)
MDRYEAIDAVEAVLAERGEDGGGRAVAIVDALLQNAPFLTLRDVIEADIARARLWHANAEEWSASDWGNAFGGEVGELLEAVLYAIEAGAHAGAAQNFIKKLRRHETGLGHSANTPQDLDELRQCVGWEAADTVLYAILVCWKMGVDLERCLIDKFNETSEANGFDIRIGLNVA